MLLPSDVARLVLGYLQEEGLSATSQAFIHESPNLKEYAEHTTGDGTIPACVFSVFGKGLTTILNEYIAAKSKESCHEVPAVMTSLWKKLEFTLKQIKSMHNLPAASACQRTRSRVGVANLARQRAVTMASAGSLICSSVSETGSLISPVHSSHCMLSHSTPVSYTGPNIRAAPGSGTHQQIHNGSRLHNIPRDSPVQIVVSEYRGNPGPMSPGRRKWDTPRKRSGPLSGSNGTGRSTVAVSGLIAEPQPEEVVDENFPQLVIQNARDKILGDRSLQEKLAENINKILANEPVPQTSKVLSSTMEADQSIDEILGLQGEIHMSDDAIHDILEQTESDPAFQALFDLFDYNKTKIPDGEPGDGEISSNPEESDTAVPSATVRQLQSDDLGTTQRDANASDTTATTAKMSTIQERKTRKSTAPTLLKKTLHGPSGRASRIENSSARLLVSHEEHRGVSSAAMGSNRKEKASVFSNTVGETPMDIDEFLNTPPSAADSTATHSALEPVTKDGIPTATDLSDSNTIPSIRNAAALETELVSKVDKEKEGKQAQGSEELPAAEPSSALSKQPAFLAPVQVELISDSPHKSASSRGGETQTASALSVTPESTSLTYVSAGATVTAAVALPSSASTAAPVAAAPASSSTFATISSAPTSSSASPTCAPATTASDTTATNSNTPSKSAADSSNIVSLKIIISDNQDEDSPGDTALNQAISSISVDKIPTIYLSSPAKSPKVPGTPRANLDETALAVSGLQSSEANLSGKAGAVGRSPMAATSPSQQSYIIQLPLDTTNPALQGATASYFLVTEPPTTDAETRQVLVPAGVSTGQPVPTSSQYSVTTPTHSPGFATGSALIIPSPVKPMMLPVSVMGQNTVGKVQMVSNQVVAVPNSLLIQQSESVQPKSPTMAVKQSPTGGTLQNLTGNVIKPLSAEHPGQQKITQSPSSSHRRILCFDSSAEAQPSICKTRATTPTAANASISHVTQTENDHSPTVPWTKPAILGGNKPKRRVETIRCSADPQFSVRLGKETEKPMPSQQQQKDGKKNSRKQEHNIRNPQCHTANTITFGAFKNSESERRSKSIDRKHNHDKGNDQAQSKDSRSSKSLPSDSVLKPGGRRDKDESSMKEPADKGPGKSREGRTEKKGPAQEMPNVTANKENEMKGSLIEQQQSASTSSAPRDLSPPGVSQPTSNSHSKASKAPSKTSSLAKQAAEMLQDIQGLNSPPRSVKKPGVSSSDLIAPRTPGTGCNQEESIDSLSTPSRQKKGKDGEGTPKHILPPNTPDVPTCSPASEAGSENSINMAAHTLMILSRAAIARTGTPLKDSLRQEGVGEKSPASSKNGKKRKQPSPTTSPPAKKESKPSSGKKKDRQEKKKLIDCFPHDLDVDKFLSSLHYDE